MKNANIWLNSPRIILKLSELIILFGLLLVIAFADGRVDPRIGQIFPRGAAMDHQLQLIAVGKPGNPPRRALDAASASAGTGVGVRHVCSANAHPARYPYAGSVATE